MQTGKKLKYGLSAAMLALIAAGGLAYRKKAPQKPRSLLRFASRSNTKEERKP